METCKTCQREYMPMNVKFFKKVQELTGRYVSAFQIQYDEQQKAYFLYFSIPQQDFTISGRPYSYCCYFHVHRYLLINPNARAIGRYIQDFKLMSTEDFVELQELLQDGKIFDVFEVKRPSETY